MSSLNVQDNVLFIHVPKTAGTSLDILYSGVYRTYINFDNMAFPVLKRYAR